MVRQAQQSDFEDIMHIRSVLALEIDKFNDLSYKLKAQKNGFLLKSPYTTEEFEKDLQKIFLVYENEGKVVGYLRIDEVQEMCKEADVFWLQPELKQQFYTLPHADIGGIAVLPHMKGKGMALEMLQKAIEEVKKKHIPYLFSFVVLSPVTNIPSLLFHEKNGFERIALPTARELFGMKDFQSFLYGKKL